MNYGVVPTRTTGVSAANAALEVSTPTGKNRRRVLYVTVAYSAEPTQGGVTIELDSGAGPGFDTLLGSGQANAQHTFWQPTDLLLLADDALKVTAPAGGDGLTSSVAIISEAVG